MSQQTYADKLRVQMRRWRVRINELEARSARVNAAGRRAEQERLQDLRAKQQAAERRLEQLERAGRSARAVSGDCAGGVRGKVRRMVSSLLSGVRRLRGRNQQ
jgi:hypothetical protein